MAFAATGRGPESRQEEDSDVPRVAEAADIASARVAARLGGERVEALSERTETSTTWVNPDGTLTTELSAGPIRFRRDGEWVDVDVDLEPREGGGFAAEAHPAGLVLAGQGGTPPASLEAARNARPRDLVRLGSGDEEVVLGWRGGLPEPRVDGTTARYRNALPGADLIVEATRTGFEQFVELRRAPRDGRFSYALTLETEGLDAEAREDGSILFTDAESGEDRAVMPAPVMWDATVDETSGEHTRTVPVDVEITGEGQELEILLTPDAQFLEDPETVYPVTVDPSTASLGNVFDTYVKQGETTDLSADTELHIGNPGTTNPDGTPRYARSFITWDTSPIRDALIGSAELELYNVHSGNTSCSGQTWTVWETGAASTSSRWTSQPQWIQQYATSTETAGRAECGGDGWIGADVTELVQSWASADVTRGYMGVRAPSGDTAQWKQVRSANAASNPPRLTVTYNYRPRTGTRQEAGPPYFSYGGAYTVNTTTPTLRDTFVDANGDRVNGTFQIYDDATNSQVGDVIVSSYVPSGQAASVTVPEGLLSNGRTYRFRTSPYDGTHYNTGWSAWRTFTVDTSAPSAPTAITSTDYPSGQWTGGAEEEGTFTVTPPAGDHQWLEWSLDGVTWTKVTTSGTAGNRDIAVTPPRDGTHTLRVRAVDRADNKSEALEYTFHAGPGGFLQPTEGERTARRLTLAAEADGSRYDSVSFSWRRSAADPWTAIPTADVTSGGQPLTAWPVPLANGENAPLVWDAAGTVTPDGTIEIKADFTGSGGVSGSTQPLTVVVDRQADGAATEEIGPGSLNLLTGDYTISESDTSYYEMAVSRTASSRTPAAGAQQTGQAAIFGDEWVAGTIAELTDSDYAHVRRISDTAVAVVTSDTSEIHFTANAAGNAWVPEPGAEALTLTGSVSGSFTLTDTEGTVTRFTRPSPSAPTWPVSSTLLDGLDNSTTTIVSETVTVDGQQLARPRMVIAPTSAVEAATCAATPTTRGCRVLEFVYATSTTATSSAFGDYAGQVREILLYATGKGGTSATARAVAAYRYDTEGRLRQQWNPRLAQSTGTEYAYDSVGRVVSHRSATDQPWTFAYGQAGSGPIAGDGMLLSVSRPFLRQGSTDIVDGNAVQTVVYDVPLAGSGAPHDMGSGDVRAWGQTDAPTDATAVFPADSVPPSHTGDGLSVLDYARSEIHYLGASAREVNTAQPGGHISTTEYDRFGNTVRELTAANRAVALGITAADRATQAGLGIAQLSSAERADLLSTESRYNATGTRELESFGPLRRVDLTENLVSGSTTLVPTGTSVTARTWTVNEYDAGRPTDGTATVRDQVTRVTTGAQVREHPGVHGERRVTQTVYDWAAGLPIQTIEDPGGLALTTTTEHDAQGRVTRVIPPGGSATGASTVVTTYWSATGTGTCQGRPEWADLLCSTGPGGAITGGGSNPAQLPTTTNEYDSWGNTTARIETANGSTRTTTTAHDGAGRPTTTTVTGGVGQAVPASTTVYDAATGRVSQITSPSGGTISQTYDTLGRLISYTDADGGTTNTAYDVLDRPVEITDTAPSTVTFTYDHTAEPRGMATSSTDSVAGTFRATYDADGSLATERLPGGYTLRITEDTTGSPIARTYTRDSDGTVVYTNAATESIHGQTTMDAGWSDQTYRYDTTGRLTSVEDTAATVCTRRAYTLNDRTNRTALTTASGAPGADCPTSGGTATNHSYDTADRLVDGGYAYDAFARATTLPGGIGIGYYTNDLAHRQTTATNRQTWQLDAALRFRSWTTEVNSGGTWTQTGSRLNHYDSDSDNPRWIIENTSTGALTRNVESLSGDLAATTNATGNTLLHLSDIHGDIALQLPLTPGQAPIALDTDEYGNPRPGQSPMRYNWLGSKQRSSETITGLTLMGVRQYNPTTGLFLTPDPIPGGNANAYEYCSADPVNCYDLDGRWGWLRRRARQFRSWAGRTMRNPNVRHWYYGGRALQGALNPITRARTIYRWARNPRRAYQTCSRNYRAGIQCFSMALGGSSAFRFGRRYVQNYRYLREYNSQLTHRGRQRVCRRYTGYRGRGRCT
ncbi:DNRLRE domain-containing protein [Streptomyces boetiae]